MATLPKARWRVKPKGFATVKQGAWWVRPRAAAPAPARRTTPLSYADLVAQDPLALPAGSELIWTGGQRPNMQTLAGRGFTQITPRQVDGQWAAVGVPTDPMPDWAQTQLDQITQRGTRTQQFAQQTVAPWLANQLSALQGASGAAQTNFANLIGSSGANLAQAAAQVGPGANQAVSPAMAPFAGQQALGAQLAAGQAQAQTGGAAYQAAVDTLQGANLGQGLQAGLAQEIARIPDRYEEQRQAFMNQLTPVLLQIQENQRQAEQQRLAALEDRRRFGLEFGEQRRQFGQQQAVEREIVGLQIGADQAQQQQAAVEREVERNFRAPAQIRSDVNQGDFLLDNAGQGWASRPKYKTYKGTPIQWEQGSDGRWYGTARGALGDADAAPTQQQKGMQAALADARAISAIEQSDPAINTSAFEVAQDLVKEHGVGIDWAYDIARRLGFNPRPGEYVSSKYRRPSPEMQREVDRIRNLPRPG